MAKTYETSPQAEIHYTTYNDYQQGEGITACCHLQNLDNKGADDPAVAIFITPEGDFKISDTKHERGSPLYAELSQIMGAITVDAIPVTTPVNNRTIPHLRSVA